MNDFDFEATSRKALRAIEDRADAFEPEVVDCDRSGDVVTLTFQNGVRCVINTQRPTKQLWVAAKDEGWHFRWDGATWVDEKGRGELFSILAAVAKANANVAF